MKIDPAPVLALIIAMCVSGCVAPAPTGPAEAPVVIKGTMVDGMFEGRAEIWSPPTIREAIGEFLGGKPSGQWTFWDSRGVKTVTLEYRDGVQHGPVEMWYGALAYPAYAGTLKLQGSLRDGRWHGTVITFYPTGQKRCERRYEAGVLVSSRGYDSGGHDLTELQARARGGNEDRADTTYLVALDDIIRNAAASAKVVP